MYQPFPANVPPILRPFVTPYMITVGVGLWLFLVNNFPAELACALMAFLAPLIRPPTTLTRVVQSSPAKWAEEDSSRGIYVERTGPTPPPERRRYWYRSHLFRWFIGVVTYFFILTTHRGYLPNPFRPPHVWTPIRELRDDFGVVYDDGEPVGYYQLNKDRP